MPVPTSPPSRRKPVSPQKRLPRTDVRACVCCRPINTLQEETFLQSPRRTPIYCSSQATHRHQTRTARNRELVEECPAFIVNQGPQDPKSAFTSEIWENSANASEDSSHGRRISARLVQRSPERKPETHELHSPYRAIGTHVCPRSVRDPWRPSFSLFLFFFDFFDFFQQKFHVFEFF